MKNFTQNLIRLLLISFMGLYFTTNLIAANLYWIGGTGNWSDATHWSLTSGGVSCSCVPTINDNVFFDASSFTTVSRQVTIDVTAYCNNMNWTGATNTPYMASSASSPPVYIYGSLTFISGMDITLFKGNVYFNSANAGQTITSAGRQFINYGNNIYFDGIGGYVLQDAFSTTGTLNLNTGQLDFNSKNVTASSFNSNNSNIRNLILGNSAVTITGNTAWNCNSTNFALSAGSSVITFTYNGWVYFSGGAQTYNNLVFSYGSGTGNIWDNNNIFNKVYFTGDGQINSTGNTFSKITFKSTGEINGNINTADSVIFTAGHAYTLGSSNTLSINKYLEAKGDCGAWINIESGTPGTQATISSAAASGITVNNVRMRDIKANGGAAFIANTSVDLGNNTGWIINTIMPKSLYWIGNSGNWIDPAHWSLTSGGASSGCIPTIYDDVFFDANSFTIFGSQVTVYVANQFEDPAAYCKNMNWTGATNSPYLSSNGHASSPLCIYGSLTFISGMNIASFEGSVYFKSVNAGQTITSAGKQFVKYGNNFYFDGIGGYVLQDAFSTTGTLNLNKGQLNFNGKNVTASSFNSNNSNIRNLILGNSAVTITGNTAWNCNSTNFALSAGSSVITFTYNGWVYFSGGAQTYNNLVFSYGSGTGNIWDNNNIFNKVYFTGDGQINSTGNTFSKITFKSTGEINGNINTADSVIFTAGHAYTLSNGNTFSINNYLEAKGDCGAWINIESDTPGSQATMNSAAASGIKVNNVRMRDIKATGGATFIANTSVDLGNNTGWTINSLAQKSLYWIGNSGNWNDPAHWSLTSGGTSSGCIPTIYDDVFFDANSFTLFGSQVTIYVANQFEDQAAYCNNMNWTGATNSPYLSSNGYSSSPLHIYGSLTLISGMNIASFEGSVYFKSVNAGQTITSAGKQFVKYGNNIYFDGIGGYILQDAFSTTGTLNLNKGQLNFNGKNVKATSFNSNNSNIRNLILGNSAVTITGNMAWNCSSTNLALSAGSSVITFTYNGWAYFGGGAQTYNNLVFSNGSGTGNIWDNNNNIFNKVYFAGDGQINSTGNTFSKITFMSKGDISGNTNIADSVIFTAGHAYTLGSGNTLKVNKYLEAVGTAASYITLQSSSGGSQTFIQKSTGNVCNEYLRLKDINAGGGADFFAGNSVDLGNNTGWHYCSCSSAPLAAGTISGTATVCQGQTNVTYTLPVIANATSYVWTLPTGVTGTSITNSISVSFGNTALSGSIRVKGLNDCGGGTESTFAVVINEIPATPVITLNTGILLSNAASGNQWYLSNSIIPNAINNTYTPSQVGDYHVIITLNGCSSQTSNIVTFNPTGIEETADKYGISVYPNPTSDILKITLNKKPGSDFVIEIYDNVGSLIQTQRKSKSETNFDIDLSSFSTGIYTLRIHASNGYSQTKVVKK